MTAKRLKPTFPLIGIVLALFGQAAAGDEKRVESPEMAFCRTLLDPSKRPGLAEELSVMRDLLEAIVSPEKFGRLVESRIPARSRAAGGTRPSRGIVFMMLATPERRQAVGFEAAETAVTTVERKINDQRRIIQRMAGARTPEECARRAASDGFTLAEARALSGKLNQELRYEKQLVDGQRLRRVIQDASGQLAPDHSTVDWDVIPFTHAASVLNALRSGEYAHVVIVAHAAQDGTLVDSEFNEIPRDVFEGLSGAIRTVTVFSCYGQKVLARYGIENALRESPSLYPDRYLFTREQIAYLGSPGATPVVALPAFLRQLTGRLDRLADRTAGATGATAPERPVCSVALGGTVERALGYGTRYETFAFRVESGAYVFSLNGRPIGILSPESDSQDLEFPCDWLKETGNVLISRDLSLIPGSPSCLRFESERDIQQMDFRLEVPPSMTNAGAAVTVTIKHFFHAESGRYRRSKFVFDWNK